MTYSRQPPFQGCRQARGETTKIKIRRTNLECALESTLSLFGVSLQHRRLGARTSLVAPGPRPAEAGRVAADVDSKGFKRTAHAIMLKINEINDFEANELQVVKSVVM